MEFDELVKAGAKVLASVHGPNCPPIGIAYGLLAVAVALKENNEIKRMEIQKERGNKGNAGVVG